MKLKGLKKSELNILGGESKQFSVDTEDTMIIRLLRDKMYKNKVAAVCREIASNARDANREAGRGEKPILIKMSNEENDILSEDEVTISFKDNGIGIAPDRMEKIFLKYGGSTKRDTDEFTGGFGIGAKTPFAYTDNFFVITVCEVDGKKMKYYYQAAITGDGKRESSQMISLGEEETTDDTGTTIQIPIDSSDVQKFEYEIIYATSFWETKPELKGFNRKYDIDVVYKGKAPFTIIKDENCLYGESAQYIALIDEIPYVLNMDKLAETKIKNLYARNYFGQEKFITLFHFDTSEITVSGSREDVEYIESNLNKFKEANKKFENEIKQHILSYFSKSTSYFDRCVRANKIDNIRFCDEDETFVKLMSQLSSNLNISKQIIYGEYEGERVVRCHRFLEHQLRVMKIKNEKMKVHSNLNYSSYGNALWELPIYYLDLSKAEPTRNAMLKKKHGENGYILIIPPKFTHENTESEEQKEKELKYFYLIGLSKKWKLYSEVEKLRKNKGSKRNITDIISINSRFLNRPGSWNRNWKGIKPKFDKKNKEFLDLMEKVNETYEGYDAEEVAYFQVDKLSDLDGTGFGNVQGMTSNESAVFKFLKEKKVFVIAISKSKAKYFKQAKIKSMKDKFLDFVKKDKNENDFLSKAINFKYANENNANSIYFNIPFGKEKDKKLNKLKKLFKFIQENKTEMKSYLNLLENMTKDFMEYFEGYFEIKISKEIEDAITVLKQVQEENPLLRFYVNKNSSTIPQDDELMKQVKKQLIELYSKANK